MISKSRLSIFPWVSVLTLPLRSCIGYCSGLSMLDCRSVTMNHVYRPRARLERVCMVFKLGKSRQPRPSRRPTMARNPLLGSRNPSGRTEPGRIQIRSRSISFVQIIAFSPSGSGFLELWAVRSDPGSVLLARTGPCTIFWVMIRRCATNFDEVGPTFLT